MVKFINIKMRRTTKQMEEKVYLSIIATGVLISIPYTGKDAAHDTKISR